VRLDRFLLSAMRGRLREAERVLAAPGAELFLAQPLTVAGHKATVLLLRGDTAAAVRTIRDAVAAADAPFQSTSTQKLIAVLAEAGATTPAGDLLGAWQAAMPACPQRMSPQSTPDRYASRGRRLSWRPLE
jgi:hypothetical protein